MTGAMVYLTASLPGEGAAPAGVASARTRLNAVIMGSSGARPEEQVRSGAGSDPITEPNTASPHLDKALTDLDGLSDSLDV